MDKKIMLRVDPFPNYIFHVYSVAMINGRDSPYRQKYINTVSDADREYLYGNRNLLAFGNGDGGELVQMIPFFPLYVRPETHTEIEEYYGLLSGAVTGKDASLFLDKYKGRYAELGRHWGVAANFEEYILNLEKYKNKITAISSIITDNYHSFLEHAWPEEKNTISGQIGRLQPLVDKGGFIQEWEKTTGFVFEYPVYEINLYTSLENVSNAVSAGYDRNHFLYEGEEKSFLTFISHETGTHILVPLWKDIDIFIEKYGYSRVYKGYETLANYYNQRITGTMRMRDYDSDGFYKIYREIEGENPNIKPSELLETGLERYAN
jgi:hypothetical protein